MLGEVWTRVDYGNLAMAYYISPGASEGEGAGIARDDAADHRCDRLEPPVFERKFATEGDLDGHAGEITGNFALDSACLLRLGQNSRQQKA
jgi:hypothetical protein